MISIEARSRWTYKTLLFLAYSRKQFVYFKAYLGNTERKTFFNSKIRPCSSNNQFNSILSTHYQQIKSGLTAS
jgi:hypothetical protein